MSDSSDKDGVFKIKAPAKTNLWLRVLGKREDGFHEIETRMVALSLADKLKLRWREDEEVSLRCSDDSLPTGEENLVVQAVRALEKHCGKVFAVDIELKKKIPSGAGLGGGSSDAAAVLLAINEMAQLNLPREELAKVGATIGSDIPFFVYERSCDCRGRGEIVEPVSEPVPSLPIFLLKPAFGISAAWAYQRFAESAEYDGFSYEEQKQDWGSMSNDLERPVFEKFPVLGEMKGWLRAQPEVEAAILSGSGSTMLAILRKEASGKNFNKRAQERYGETTWSYLGETC
ncbi:MAG: 4-(cytidine 5'-diphospho)-2-C-methyl-D-erythritol kinase [Verrucomicrobiales bacterium]|jgi:4-diphosphocytidyl-2-C-methyl-D-erythritol kinase|nr:4-(cytidine 5'-diphospho)-2-C-methyl-D-erythritol kinase [Verrucomicrobiales bacterium]